MRCDDDDKKEMVSAGHAVCDSTNLVFAGGLDDKTNSHRIHT